MLPHSRCSQAVSGLWQGKGRPAGGSCAAQGRRVRGAAQCWGPCVIALTQFFCPWMFSAPSLWAPELEPSRTVTSYGPHTNRCVSLLLFTARAASPSTFPALLGLGFSSFGWAGRVRRAQPMEGEHPRWAQLLGLLFLPLLHFPTPLGLSLSPASLIPLT